MKHADASALTVLDATTGRPMDIVTETDITHAVADRKDLNETRIHELMTRNPTVVPSTGDDLERGQTHDQPALPSPVGHRRCRPSRHG